MISGIYLKGIKVYPSSDSRFKRFTSARITFEPWDTFMGTIIRLFDLISISMSFDASEHLLKGPHDLTVYKCIHNF